MSTISELVSEWINEAICDLMPGDVVEYDVTVFPLPTDTEGWVPSLFVLFVIQPVQVGSTVVDGKHKGEFLTPYGLTQDFVRAVVETFTIETQQTRQALRQARKDGGRVAPGVAMPPMTV